MFQGHELVLKPSMKPEKTVGLLRRELAEIPPTPAKFDVVADVAFSKKHQVLVLQGYYSYFENIRAECVEAEHKISLVSVKLIACLKNEEKLHRISQASDELLDLTEDGRKLRLVQENLPVYANRIQEFKNKLDHQHSELFRRSEVLAEDKRYCEGCEMSLELCRKEPKSCSCQGDSGTGSGERAAGFGITLLEPCCCALWAQLNYNDEQIHKFEKINLSAHIKKVKSLLREDCSQKYHDVLALVGNWTSVLHEIQGQLKEFGNFFLQLIGDLQMCDERQNKNLDAVLLQLQQGMGRLQITDGLKDKDHMILRMNRLKEEMESVARELQCNNSIIESLGSMNTGPGI
ncbi:hypothetical protein COCON_G00172890 [Conger conger]|uniref:TANK-binding kinase 1 coiled-coil domain-containing protein n=1 Tax=Conger conger TaxID=82655 RepID=A0A9Q1D4Q6_CONCO|nr:hypothetical protein COCON_G00172890 [Conger conger]